MKSILLKTTLFLALLLLINQLVMAQTTTTLDKTHPAYSELTNLQRNVKSIQKYYEKEQFNTTMNTYLGFVKKSIEKMKSKFPDVDISSEISEYEKIQTAYIEKDNEINGHKKVNTTEKEYFLNMMFMMQHLYSEENQRGGDWLEASGEEIVKAYEQIKDFKKEEYLKRVEDAKVDATYATSKSYITPVINALNDYDNYISRLENLFNNRIKEMDLVGTKGNPEKELQVLKDTEVFCKMLFVFSPTNPTVTKWHREVQSRIKEKENIVSNNFTSNFHKEHLNQVVFSKSELKIGSESESDLTTNFKTGDYIYGTIYLGNTVRKSQDSYAVLPINIYINGDLLKTLNQTGVWVTTPMQENTYLQFALSPSLDWIAKNYQPYIDDENFTLGQFNEFLASKGNYEHTIKLEIKFRDIAGARINGEFKIDLANNGSEFYADLGRKLKNKTLSGVSLPKAGMNDSGLQNQMLQITKSLNKDSKVSYVKAIIISKAWDIERNKLTGIILGRSIQGALVSKNSDGSCHFQFFLFKQDYNGSGYNDNLKFGGAGDRTTIPCENID